MKDHSAEFISKEEGTKRQPAELYHIWQDTTHYRYTSGDVAVVYNGETYSPATINRKSSVYDEKLEVNTLTIQFSRVTDPALEFIAVTPTDLIWVSVHKLHRDMLVEETTNIFIGQVKSMSFQGSSVQAKCVGFEHFLNQVVPRYRYGPGCQHTLYDSRCRLTAGNYAHTIQLDSVSEDGLTLTSTGFSDFADNYFTLGYFTFGRYSRMFTTHIEGTVGMRYFIVGLEAGSEIVAYAGCDKTRATCINKFNNLNNNLSFPNIPRDNPSMWTGAT